MSAEHDRCWTVAWDNHATGQEGRGAHLLNRQAAENWAAALNRQTPHVLHWAVRVVEDEPPNERAREVGE